jgi:hypothetical protein
VPLSAASDQFCGRRLSLPGRAGALGLAIIIEGALGAAVGVRIARVHPVD